jgi:nicotinamide-nucleotide amidase
VSDTDNYSSLLFNLLKDKKLTMTAAESCTGGLVSKIMTDFPGSSDIFWRSFITYSNNSKMKLLGIKSVILDSYGAVSKQTVQAMAKGAIDCSGADCSVSVSGIAGPGGGSRLKPVGTVWICAALKQGVEKVEKFHFKGSRSDVREKTAESALKMLYHLISELDY